MGPASQVRQFTNPKLTRPYWLRPVNAVGKLFLGKVKPNSETWMLQARQSVPGIAPDLAVTAALDTLVAAMNKDARLNFIGATSARADTVRTLKNHLRIKQLLASQPEIASTRLPDPLFIVGLPRTGSTFLHHLLACDPQNRTIPYWESFEPVPPQSGIDERATRVDGMLRQLQGIAPGYQAIHPMAATGPEECVALFMNALRTLQYDFQYHIPDYVKWLRLENPAIAYHCYHDQLKIIQHYRPAGERFLLKDPTHACNLATVLDIFPNARIIFTHRHPEPCLSSLCSLYAHTRAIFSDNVDPHALGHEVWTGYWPDTLDSMLAIRAQLDRSQFIDVTQAKLARHPLDTARAVYDHFGYELSENAYHAMQAFLAPDTSIFRRMHEHSPEGFGLDRRAISRRFLPYIEEFRL